MFSGKCYKLPIFEVPVSFREDGPSIGTGLEKTFIFTVDPGFGQILQSARNSHTLDGVKDECIKALLKEASEDMASEFKHHNLIIRVDRMKNETARIELVLEEKS